MQKINKISPDDNPYTQLLSNLAVAPGSLYFLGKLPEHRRPSVAIIGTRKPSPYGREVTSRLSYDLAKKGVVIISGLALGIDGLAHRAALDAGGTTLAVLAGGLPDISPRSHRDLAKDIITSGGAIITEYEPGTPPMQFRFLERNRIVSGLSDAIIITEAAAQSGTISTATHALEQGREVFVVPGNITSPLSAGCNRLLKQGANPVTCAEDVLEVIAPQLLKAQSILPLGNNSQETKIIELLQSGIRDGDELLSVSAIPASDFKVALTMLEIAGAIKPLGANQWTLR